MSEERRANRLAKETSPYLLQHAYNPVDWFPWGEEALAAARRRDVPILLSIGYSACHWCHVMERESFEDAATARLMNEHFVSVKVDREERPDIDAIYMDAVQAMTGHGGWPLTAFLTPDGEPFYAGTYFPDEERHGMPAFRRVLAAIAETWETRRDEAVTQARRVVEALARARAPEPSADALTEAPLVQAVRRLRGAFDARWGGFGAAPKFPQPMILEFLLRAHLRGVPDALGMLTTTLDRIAAGGMHDQVGGGFHRYSTDERWHVPHFEKMLYDNAQLARLYTRAWQVTGIRRYREVAARTCAYLLREMQHAEGGFYSSQDADSEGVEGRFFVWSWEELVAAVGEAVAVTFGAARAGNWDGTNVLWLPHRVAGVADEYELDPRELERDVETARDELFELRKAREHPATDDKVLAGWNGLAISALAETGRALGEPRYVEQAARAATFVLTHLRDDDGRLQRSWRAWKVSGAAFADDHALMAEACLTLYETTFDLRWFTEARALADELLRRFLDPERGGFFQTGNDAEELVLRPRDLEDNAVPSANSAAAEVLLRLGLFTGEAEYERAGIAALRSVGDGMERVPSGFGHALSALDLHLSRAKEIAIVGELGDPTTRALVDEVTARRFLPNRVLAVAAPDDHASARAVPLLRDRPAIDGRPTAYVCERFVCRLPITTPEALAAEIGG